MTRIISLLPIHLYVASYTYYYLPWIILLNTHPFVRRLGTAVTGKTEGDRD
jgi:hypothetical protein